VYASPTGLNFNAESLVNNRANLLNPALVETSLPSAGGRIILNRSAFAEPVAGTVGNTGRNAFRGPGFYSLDLSVSRSFRLPWIGESGRLTVRADAFNFLNHANLNNPESQLNAQRPFTLDFGEALYGRTGRATNFPALVPLDETARQIQLLLRLEF
jgi:hypothetical protein